MLPILALLVGLSFTGHVWAALAILFVVSWMGW